MSGYEVVGKRLPRLDGLVKVTGHAQYTNDLVLPRMLHGRILRSPHPHARILHIDSTRAERLPGVRAVITGKDTAGVKYGLVRGTRDQHLLAMDKVRYVGDEVAAVAAIDEDIAQEALDLIKVEYEILPAVFDPEEAMQEGAPRLHDHAERNISAQVSIEYGDVAEGFGKADYVREDRFETEAIAHCQLEPYSAVAQWDPSGRLRVWMPNQSPFTKQKSLSTCLKMPMNDITVGRVFIGGGFGGRSDLFAPEFCAALLSRQTGRPVKIACTREENFFCTRQKHPFVIWIKTGVKRDGTLLAREYRVLADGGAYSTTAVFLLTNVPIILLALYRLPNLRFQGYRVYTNKPVRGAMKGHGNQQVRFADESQMDMIAEELGMDPLELRLKNAVRPGDMLPNRSKVFSCGLAECMREAARRGRWEERRRSLSRKAGAGVGIGCSPFISGYSYGYRTGSTALVKFNEDGQALVITGMVDNGQGNETMAAQIAAEGLGVAPSDVRILWGNTAEAPMDPGTHSMTSTFVSGNAVRLASIDARRQVLELAAEEMEASAVDLDVQDGRVFVKGSPERGLPLRAVVMAGLSRGKAILGRGTYMPQVDLVDFSKGEINGQVAGTYTFGAAAAEVEVDVDTGQIKVTKVAAAQDCGLAINPTMVEGQIEGSVSFGFGQTVTEGLFWDGGCNLNPSFLDYRLPTALDVPQVDPLIVETVDSQGPFGAKEAAEAVGVAVIPAITNAVHDAVGLRVKTLPLYPERVLEALDGAKPRG